MNPKILIVVSSGFPEGIQQMEEEKAQFRDFLKIFGEVLSRIFGGNYDDVLKKMEFQYWDWGKSNMTIPNSTDFELLLIDSETSIATFEMLRIGGYGENQRTRVNADGFISLSSTPPAVVFLQERLQKYLTMFPNAKRLAEECRKEKEIKKKNSS